MTPNEYLEILGKASPTDHPFLSLDASEELGATFAKMTHGMVEFVEACRAHPEMGYARAVQNIEDVTHYFPKEHAQGADLVAALNRIFAAQDPDQIDQEAYQA